MNKKNLKSAMVTGAAGFIGSHLIEYLLNKNYLVKALDIPNLKDAKNLEKVRNHPNLVYTSGDIRDKKCVDDFFCNESYVIYHLASVVGVRRYMEDPLSLIDISVIGTKNILNLCIKNDTRVLFTSTSEIYGNNKNIPWKETHDRVLGDPSIDRWCYSTSKALVEHMLFALSRTKSLKFSTIRFFNVYGPRQHPIYVVSQSIYRILKGEKPDIYDSGQQTRCFTYIDDVIEGIYLAATKKEALGNVFNIGNNKPSTMSEVVNNCIKLSGINLKPNFVDTNKKYGEVYQDIENRVPDVTKAKDILGWSAKTDTIVGLKKTIDWVKSNDWYLEIS